MLTNVFVRDRFTWLAYLMLAYFAYAQAIIGPLMPFLRAELKLNYTTAGLHGSLFALGMIVAGLSGDRLARQWGRRVVFWGGGAGMAAGAVILAGGDRVLLTLAGALLMGGLGSFLLVMIQASLSDRHGEQRAIALTESNVAASISASLAPVLIGAFQRSDWGWRSALYLIAAAFASLFIYFQTVVIPDNHPAATLKSNPGAPPSLPKAYWAYWSVVMLVVSVEWCLIFWGADYLVEKIGLSKVNAATMMSVFFGAMVLGRIIGSRLSRTVASPTLLLSAIGIAGVGFGLFWLASFGPLNITGLFFAGLGVANTFPLTLTVAVSVGARRNDAASARIALASGLAILISPLVLGWVADQLNLQNAFGVVAGLLLAAATVTFLTNRLTRAHPGR